MYQLQVEGMSCNHCISTVTRSVRQVDGNATVEVDLATQMVRVESRAALEDIAFALSEAGFPVIHSAA